MIISIGKKRTNRLAIFDKKVTSLDNQAEILGIKLELLEGVLLELGKEIVNT